LKRAALKRSALGKIDAEGGKEGFEVFCGHVLAFELDVDLGGFASGFVRAAEMSSGAADFESGRFETPAFLPRLYLVLKSTVRERRPANHQQ